MPDPISPIWSVVYTSPRTDAVGSTGRAGRRITTDGEFMSALRWVEGRLDDMLSSRTQPRTVGRDPNLGQNIDFLA